MNVMIKDSRLWLKKRARDKTHNTLINRALYSLDMYHLSEVRVLHSHDFISVKCQSKQYEKFCTESTWTLSPLALLKSLKDSALGLSELGGPNNTTCKRLFYLSSGDFGVGPLDIE